MINLDDRLLDDGLVNDSEAFLLLQIAKRINRNRSCFPNNLTLLKDTGWGLGKLNKVKSSLIQKGFLSVAQRRKNGIFCSNIYTIKTRFISIFVNLADGEYEEEANEKTESPQDTAIRFSDYGKADSDTAIRFTDYGKSDHISINQSLEVLTREEEINNNINTPFLQKENPTEKVEIKKQKRNGVKKKSGGVSLDEFLHPEFQNTREAKIWADFVREDLVAEALDKIKKNNNLYQCDSPLTPDELVKLYDTIFDMAKNIPNKPAHSISWAVIVESAASLANYPKKYNSAYLTLLNWAKRSISQKIAHFKSKK